MNILYCRALSRPVHRCHWYLLYLMSPEPELMRHSNPLMLLKHYQYVMDTQKRAAVEALPDVPKAMRPKKNGTYAGVVSA